MPVHQFLPDLAPADAIGNHVLEVRKLCRAYGPSEIYVERADITLTGTATQYERYDPQPGDVAIYHASVGSPMAKFFRTLEVPLVVNYHNVTPVHFFAPYEPRVAAVLYSGRGECAALASSAVLGLAHSTYSENELRMMGYRKTDVYPIFLDMDAYDDSPDLRFLDTLKAGKKGTDILFVGRISPQKRQEDLIKVFKVFKEHFDPDARLFLAGKSSSHRYSQVLEEFIAALDLRDVIFTGGLTFKELLAHFRNADVYLSLSEHEGFGVPLIEAMKLGVPVIAYASSGVGETVGDGGLLFAEKDYEEIAALVHEVVNDAPYVSRLAQAGRARAESFRAERHHDRFRELIESVMS